MWIFTQERPGAELDTNLMSDLCWSRQDTPGQEWYKNGENIFIKTHIFSVAYFCNILPILLHCFSRSCLCITLLTIYHFCLFSQRFCRQQYVKKDTLEYYYFCNSFWLKANNFASLRLIFESFAYTDPSMIRSFFLLLPLSLETIRK